MDDQRAQYIAGQPHGSGDSGPTSPGEGTLLPRLAPNQVEVPFNYHGRRCGGQGNFGIQCLPVPREDGLMLCCQYCGVDLLAFDPGLGWIVIPFLYASTAPNHHWHAT